MQIQVIKDKLPELVKEQEKIINYAECKNNELFLEMLVNQVGTACNQFFAKPTVENIIEIQLVLDTILEANEVSEETYKQIRDEMVNQMGTYSKRFIGFFQESAAQSETNA